MFEKCYIYIITNKNNSALYIGVTGELSKENIEHIFYHGEGFEKDNLLNKLVYFEEYKNIKEAIQREKQLKLWKKEWKKELINKSNPEWKDLLINSFFNNSD